MTSETPRPSALVAGMRIGPYEIAEKIGAGGMGEVYRATDTKLRREVAIKVLPPEFTADPERLARFEREAHLLAQLHHPNIASIFGLEEADGVRALALELVEGATLAERLEGGRLPVEISLRIAIQVARALEEAHAKGIVHRDLKPQNIKASVEGTVKVLDFGLAKVLGAVDHVAPSADLSMSPTVIDIRTPTETPETQVGVVMGTAAYMSPEQARGAAVDKRADIWAFGVVLYEMLAGKSLFAGGTLAETIAGVLKGEIDLSALPPDAPAELRMLLRRCLERDTNDRLHDIADARIVLNEILSDELPSAPRRPSMLRRSLPWGIAAAAIVAATAGWFGRGPTSRAVPEALTVFGVLLPEDNYLARYEWPLLDVSPDGRKLLVVAESEGGTSIFVRNLDALGFERVAGTEGAEHPMLSPDGRSIAYFAAGQLRKIPVDGGAYVELADAQAHRGATWAPDGSIIFSPVYSSGLWRVAATGGEATPLTSLDESQGERTHRWPQILPDGNAVIFTVGLMSNTSSYDVGTVDAFHFASGERKTLLHGARMARYANGYLVFQRNQTLLASRFDPERLEILGEPFVIREGVGGDAASGVGYFDIGGDGTLVFVPEDLLPTRHALAFVDRDGTEVELPLEPASFVAPRLSPSGDRIALTIGSGGLADDDVYVYDRATERLQRLTFSGDRGFPSWSPDGRRIIFTVGASGGLGLATKPADGGGSDTLVPLTGEHIFLVDAWLPDNRLVVTDTQRSLDVYFVDLDTGAISDLLVDPNRSQATVDISPDGGFIAYASSESGSNEVYVETLPRGGGRWQVSVSGGACPAWARDGSELYFAQGSTVMAADVDLDDVFRSAPPVEILRGAYRLCQLGRREFDVTRDGRFVVVKRKLMPGQPREMVLLRGWEAADPDR